MKSIDTLTVKRRTSVDEFNKGVFSAEETFKGRYNDECKEFMNDKGIQLVSESTVYYTPPVTLKVGDLVKNDTNEFKPVKGISIYRNSTGKRTVSIAFLTNGRFE